MINKFIETGYAIARGVVPEADLAALLDACRRLTAADDGWAAPASAVCADPIAGGALFGPRALAAVEALLGPEFVLLPSVTVRKNVYVDWHIDAAFRTDLGGIGVEPTFVQCAIYAQANDAESGGGLSIVPGSHRRVLVEGALFAPARCLDVLGQSEPIASAPGDLVLWDARALHASTPPRGRRPAERYGLFASFARRDAAHGRFVEHLRRRASERRRDGDERENRRYADALSLRLPDDFAPVAAQALTRRGISMAT